MLRRLLGSLMLLCYSSSLIVSAAPPVWWSQVGVDGYAVIDPTATDPNPQGPANIGQAKFMAKRALESLRAIAPGTASNIETDLVGPGKMIPSWDVPVAGSAAAQAQRSPLLVGQLKAIAAPFYQHLHALNSAWLETQLEANQTKDSADSSNYYPWTSATTDDANLAIATIGQLKAVFSLEFESLDPNRDSDGDGLTNAEEIAFGSNPNNPDSDGDGLTDAQEKFFGTDPQVADSEGKANGTIKNGDFSDHGSAAGSSHEAGWDYWPGIPGWTAYSAAADNTKTNIELQTLWSIPKVQLTDPANPYCELKAHPAGNYGITQPVPTETGKTYILALDCRTRVDVDPAQSNFDIKIEGTTEPGGTTVKHIIFTDHSAWATQAVVFTAAKSGIVISLIPTAAPDNTVGCLVDNVRFIPVDIEEVISDQISGNDANKLPTLTAANTNNPMLMATRTGRIAHLAVKVNVSSAIAPKVFVGVRKAGGSNVLGYAAAVPSPGKTLVQFTVDQGHELYEVVAGHDGNANSVLDPEEVNALFSKTPPGAAPPPELDKIRVVDQSQFVTSKNYLDAGANWPSTDYSGDLLEAFALGEKTVEDATLVTGITIDSTHVDLSHEVGAKWNASNQDATYLFDFADGTEPSDDVEASDGLKSVTDQVIQDNINSLITFGTGKSGWVVSKISSYRKLNRFFDTESGAGWNELGLAFGGVWLEGDLEVSYQVTSPTQIQTGSIRINGSFSDLYDFNFKNGGVSESAAMVEAGHASLSTAAEPAGKVFFTRVHYDTGWRPHQGTYNK